MGMEAGPGRRKGLLPAQGAGSSAGTPARSLGVVGVDGVEETLQLRLVEDAICKEELELLQGQLPIVCKGGRRAAGVRPTGRPQIQTIAKPTEQSHRRIPIGQRTPARGEPLPESRSQFPNQRPTPTGANPQTNTHGQQLVCGTHAAGIQPTASTCPARQSPRIARLTTWAGTVYSRSPPTTPVRGGPRAGSLTASLSRPGTR